MPAFVYLIPAIALFGAEPVHGDRGVGHLRRPAGHPARRRRDPRRLQHDHRSGDRRRLHERQLLWKVQLPLSRRALLLAANQGIVLVLAMVVVGGLVGAGALGFDVVAGFAQREDFGKGLAAGIAIVLLGIMLDRITQGAGGRPSTEGVRGG